MHDKGILVERQGRKAMGLREGFSSYDCQVAKACEEYILLVLIPHTLLIPHSLLILHTVVCFNRKLLPL